MWTGGFSCPGENVALLACVAKAGYHSNCQYQWFRNNCSLDDECHPILYASECGSYKCVVQCQDREPMEFKFSIQGIYILLPSNLHPLFKFIFDATVSA